MYRIFLFEFRYSRAHHIFQHIPCHTWLQLNTQRPGATIVDLFLNRVSLNTLDEMRRKSDGQNSNNDLASIQKECVPPLKRGYAVYNTNTHTKSVDRPSQFEICWDDGGLADPEQNPRKPGSTDYHFTFINIPCSWSRYYLSLTAVSFNPPSTTKPHTSSRPSLPRTWFGNEYLE